MPPSNVDKARSTGIDLTGILNLGKAVTGSKSTTTTSRAPNVQANLDQLIATLTGAQGDYTKDAAIADNTGAAYRVQQLLQQAMPQINSAQLQSGLYSPTTAQLLQNNLASQVTNAELNAQQQQIKDYADIQARQAQAAASAAQASGQTQQTVTPGVGLEGLLLPMAASIGMQKGYDLIFGSGAASGAGTAAGNIGADASIKSLLGGSQVAGVNPAAAPTLFNPTSTMTFDAAGNLASASGSVGNLAPVVAPSAYGNIAFSAPDAAAWFADDAAMMASQGFGSAGSAAGAASTAGAGSSWMSTAGSYASAAMPYVAAALVVDQLTGGQVSKGITSASDVIGTKEPLDDLTDSIGDFIRNPLGSVGDFVSNVSENFSKHDPVTATFRSLGTIICTALHDTGYMTSYLHRAATVYTARNVPSHVYQYYLDWATPIAAEIRTEARANWSLKTKLAAKLLTAYAKHAAGKASWFETKVAKAFIAYNTYQADKLQAQYAGV